MRRNITLLALVLIAALSSEHAFAQSYDPQSAKRVATLRAELLKLNATIAKLYAQKQYVVAEPLMNQSLLIMQQAQVPVATMADGYKNYAKLLRRLDRITEAQKYESKARGLLAGNSIEEEPPEPQVSAPLPTAPSDVRAVRGVSRRPTLPQGNSISSKTTASYHAQGKTSSSAAAPRAQDLGVVGMKFEATVNGARVLQVFPGTPAAKAGIGAGDMIVAIDGANIGDSPKEVIYNYLVGKPGTQVVLVGQRGGKLYRAKLTRMSLGKSNNAAFQKEFQNQ